MNEHPPRRLPSRSVDAEVLVRLTQIEEGQQTLLRGQADLTVAFGRIWRRVDTLEQDAKWKKWALNIGRAALPFLGGVAVSKWPWLAGVVGDILKAAAGTP